MFSNYDLLRISNAYLISGSGHGLDELLGATVSRRERASGLSSSPGSTGSAATRST